MSPHRGWRWIGVLALAAAGTALAQGAADARAVASDIQKLGVIVRASGATLD